MSKRKIKDALATTVIGTATLGTVGILIVIVGFIFRNGLPLISADFLTRDYMDMLKIVHVEVADAPFENNRSASEHTIFMDHLGIELEISEDGWIVSYVASDSPVRRAVDNEAQPFPIRRGFVVEGIGGTRINEETSPLEVRVAFEEAGESMSLRVRSLGGGVWPLIVSTFMLIGTTLVLAVPISILAAIYMVEYAKQGRSIRIIRFAVEILAGMPSVVYGLFGMLFFVQLLGIGQSMLA